MSKFLCFIFLFKYMQATKTKNILKAKNYFKDK